VIRTQSLVQAYQTRVTNDRQMLAADAPVDKGGGAAGFGAHELLEAALAVCINMAVRMHADARTIPLESASTRVQLVRPNPETICFDFALELAGPLSDDQRAELRAAARTCPVRQTLSRRIEFNELDA
jgi:putative redox protein